MLTRILVVVFLSLASVSIASAQSRTAELNDAGWKALKKGDGDRAASLFREALTLRPNDPVLLLGAGAAAHMQGRETDAMARLKRAVELDPRLNLASRLLGEIAYQQGDVDLAIRTYEQALKHAPDDAWLASRLKTWRGEVEAHHGFEERRYDRFRVMFEGRADEQLAARATSVLESAFWRIGEALGTYPSDAVIVILYTEKQFRDITRAPEWSGGVYDGSRIRIPVQGAAQDLPAFDRVLAHELTHAIVASVAPVGVPGWLTEGLAQYFEPDDVSSAKRRVKARRGSIPLRYLEGSFSRLSAAEAQIAYDESLVAVSVLFERPGFGWTRLFNDLAGGEPFERVIERFGFSYADLEVDFPRQR
jgi:tetratricopeptide (TPR) repeat protein